MYSNRDSVLMDCICARTRANVLYTILLRESRNNWIKFKIDQSIDIMLSHIGKSTAGWNFKWHLWIWRFSICHHIASKHEFIYRERDQHSVNKATLFVETSVTNPTKTANCTICDCFLVDWVTQSSLHCKWYIIWFQCCFYLINSHSQIHSIHWFGFVLFCYILGSHNATLDASVWVIRQQMILIQHVVRMHISTIILMALRVHLSRGIKLIKIECNCTNPSSRCI